MVIREATSVVNLSVPARGALAAGVNVGPDNVVIALEEVATTKQAAHNEIVTNAGFKRFQKLKLPLKIDFI
jgi:hypothetical protein